MSRRLRLALASLAAVIVLLMIMLQVGGLCIFGGCVVGSDAAGAVPV